MANPNKYTNLLNEDFEADYQSTVQQYNMLAHLLHLPQSHELREGRYGNQRRIIKQIADQIGRARGALIDRARMETELNQEFQQERITSQKIEKPPMNNTSRVTEHVLADAWLKVIYKHFDTSDIRGLIDQIPAAIRPLGNNGRWKSVGPVDLQINAAPAALVPCTIEVDLTDSHWRSGTLDEVRRNITGRNPSDVGMVIESAGAPQNFQITAALANQILERCRCQVIDPSLRLRVVEFTVPNPAPAGLNAGYKVTVDVPGLLREHPAFAQHTAAQMVTNLGGNLNVYRIFVTYRNEKNEQVAAPGAPAAINSIVTALFNSESRPGGQSFASRESSLEAAIQVREPINGLLRGTADNRELLLALSVIQRDPLTVATLQRPADSARVQTEMRNNPRLAAAAEAIEQLRGAALPIHDNPTTADGIAATEAVIGNLLGEFDTALAPLAVTPGTHSAPALNVAIASGVPGAAGTLTALGVNATVIPRRVVNAAGAHTDNHSQCEAVIRQAQDANRACRESRDRRNTIVTLLNTIGDALRQNGINHARLVSAGYTNLAHHLDPASMQAAPASIGPATNKSALVSECLNAFGLTMNENLTGSEGCWAVVRRGLENQGLRGDELKSTLEYMRNKVQMTPESVRNIEELAQQEYVTNEESPTNSRGTNKAIRRHNALLEREAHHEWNSGKEHRGAASITTGATYGAIGTAVGANAVIFSGLALTGPVGWGVMGGLGAAGLLVGLNRNKFDPWPIYKRNLFSRNGVGMGLEDDPYLLRLPHLIDVYFRTKYLYDLPTSDPRHLPHSPEIDRFMNRVYRAILHRAQMSVNTASGFTSREYQELQAMAGRDSDPKKIEAMTAAERMQSVLTYLHGNDYYTEVNKGRIEKMVDQAYGPIKKKLEWYQKRNTFVKDRFWNVAAHKDSAGQNASGWNPLSWPAYAVHGAGIGAKKIAWDAPKAVVQGTWKNKWKIAIGAALGTLVLPGLGTIIGGGIGAAKKDQSSSSDH